MTTQIPNSMLVSPGGGLVQVGAIAASTTVAPNATAVQTAIAAVAGGLVQSGTLVASTTAAPNATAVQAAIAAVGSSAPTVTAFSQAVQLDISRTMGTFTQVGALAFTLSGAAVANTSNRATIIPDGVSAITFPGFTQAAGGDVFAAGFRMTAIFYAIDALSPKYLWDKGAAVTTGTLSYTTYAALSEDVTAAGYQDYVNFTGGGVGAINTFVKNGVGLIGALSGVNLTWAGGGGSFTISGTDGSPSAVFSGSSAVKGYPTTVASIGYFEISLPAGIAVKHARCQVSTYNANFAMLPVLRAHLSDSSALDLAAPIPSVVGYGITESGINISYSAASPGQTLRLRFELPANADASANLQIQLVTYQ